MEASPYPIPHNVKPTQQTPFLVGNNLTEIFSGLCSVHLKAECLLFQKSRVKWLIINVKSFGNSTSLEHLQ